MLLLSPLTLLLLALAVALLALAWQHRGVALGAGLLALLAVLAMTPMLANALVGAVESRAQPRPGECSGLQAVVFLSGGLQREPDSSADLAALTSDTLARVFGLLRHRGPAQLPLVISGGGPFSVAESDVIATLMTQLGTDPDLVVLEPHSRSTWDSAWAVRRVLAPEVRHIALASSALHLPRAARVYRAAGFEVCPWPLSTRRLYPQGPGALVPQSSGLRKSEDALYEIAGNAYYALRLLLTDEDSRSR